MTKDIPVNFSEVRVNERRITCRFDRVDLRRLVAEAAARAAGIDLNSPGVDFEVKFEDQLEGSPSYRVGTKAEVRIVIDLTAGVPDAPTEVGAD